MSFFKSQILLTAFEISLNHEILMYNYANKSSVSEDDGRPETCCNDI